MIRPGETLEPFRSALAIESCDARAIVLPHGAAGAPPSDAAVEQALRRATGRADIALGRRPSGRPRLLPPYPELGVSLARRGAVTLVGFSPATTVGVDIELASSLAGSDPLRLARDHFSAAEAARMARLEPAAARDLFLRLWVAKEAVLKATGRGVFDGVAEPDLALAIDGLRQAPAELALARGGSPEFPLTVARLPAGHGRPARGDGPMDCIYVALAAMAR